MIGVPFVHARLHGLPVAQGRPRFRRFRDRTGASRVAAYDPAASRAWKRTVQIQMRGRPRPACPRRGVPLAIALEFCLPRPASLPKRVTAHTRRPDVDNLTKAVLDALRGIAYHDDAQVVDLRATKRYDASPGVIITVWQVSVPPPARAVLMAVVGAHPKPVDRERISDATGYQRSTRDTYLQRLSARKLVVADGRGQVRAAQELFG